MRLQISNLTINLGAAMPIGAEPAATLTTLHPEPANDAPLGTVPRIGAPWPGQGGIYAGLSRGEDGGPDAHIVLLDAVPAEALDWAAANAWAEGLGEGARLPTRFESALLYANVRDALDTDRYHWTGTQFSESYAWFQGFSCGGQDIIGKSFKARARAVRRLTA